MRLLFQKMTLVVAITAILLIMNSKSMAQEDTTPKKKLRSPAVVKGKIGGESHDSYVIRAIKGQHMTVEILWMPNGENNASFTVSESSNFFNAGPMGFGKESENGKRWVGRIPKTKNYYIYVVGHPIVDYTLKVTVK